MFYPPSEDTYLMEDALRERPETGVKCIVEVGSGSGYISNVLSMLYPSAHVISTDINPHATEETRRACCAINATAVRASMVEGIKKKIDMAVFNPPYLPSEQKYLHGDWIDRSWAGGADGMEITDKFFAETSHIPVRYVVLCQYNNPRNVEARLMREGYSVQTIKQKKVLNERLLVIRIEKAPEP
ncbi:release factor glutamine methyltransferase [Nematocida major]|uniref:release factor glutamine methyltransferase n=1 Tax=Nematocida major TaxID=1912982 RepID=UPI002008EA67|nr:release factor glutamine methyltransferase [Nematocida major]KAH9385445.1 release factor glutamine methyltransferase [Nematocida major]